MTIVHSVPAASGDVVRRGASGAGVRRNTTPNPGARRRRARPLQLRLKDTFCFRLGVIMVYLMKSDDIRGNVSVVGCRDLMADRHPTGGNRPERTVEPLGVPVLVAEGARVQRNCSGPR